MRLNIGVLVSGGGSNLQAIIDAAARGDIPGASLAVVISNVPNVCALERARRAHIPALVIDHTLFRGADEYNAAVAGELAERGVTLVCLAGYLRLVCGQLLERFAGRIINIHPALLPRHGGRGLYGRRVHEAVIASGERESGATVHLVDEIYDHGAILAQEKVPVYAGDTAESLAERVLTVEHRLYPDVLRRIAVGDIRLSA